MRKLRYWYNLSLKVVLIKINCTELMIRLGVELDLVILRKEKYRNFCLISTGEISTSLCIVQLGRSEMLDSLSCRTSIVGPYLLIRIIRLNNGKTLFWRIVLKAGSLNLKVLINLPRSYTIAHVLSGMLWFHYQWEKKWMKYSAPTIISKG